MSDNTFNNLNLVLQKDQGVSQQIQLNTSDADVGLKLNYDIGTGNTKTFSITRDGINFTDNTNNQTTGLDRLASVQQAFASVELPPNATTLKINNTLLATNGTNNITIDASANVITAATFSGALTGTATNATNTTVTADATNASFFPTFVSATTGNLPQRVDADLTYNPSTNTLTAATFNGALTGNATTATTATNATNTTITADNTNASFYPTFVSDVSGNLPQRVDTSLTYNPSTNSVSITSGVNTNILNPTSEVFNITPNLTTPYPTTYSDTTRITGVEYDASNNLNIDHQQALNIVKNIVPVVTTDDLGNTVTTSSTLPVTPLATPSIGNTAIFPGGNQLIMSNSSISKLVQIQDFSNPSVFYDINFIDSVTAGATNYPITDLSANYIAQIIPVSYTSATSCVFYLYLTTGAASAFVYLLKCDGNPQSIASYVYAPNRLSSGTASPTNSVGNGLTNAALLAISNNSSISSGRAYISAYDSVNDLFLMGMGGGVAGNQTFAIVNSTFTASLSCNFSIGGVGTNVSFYFSRSTLGVNASVQIFTFNSTTTGSIVFKYWNPTYRSLTVSALTPVAASLPGFTCVAAASSYNQDTYVVDTNAALYCFFTYIDNTVPTARNLMLACYSWDKVAASSPALVFTRVIESTGTTTPATSLGTYVSLNVPNVPATATLSNILNNTCIEIFSCITGNLYNSIDSLLTRKTTNLSASVTTGYASFTNPEQETDNGGGKTWRNLIMYPPHLILRASSTTPLVFQDIILITTTVAQPQTATSYLTFNYNSTTAAGTVSSTRPISYSASPLTLNAVSNSLLISGLGTQTEYNRVNIKAGTVCQSTNYYAQYNLVSNLAVPNGSTTTLTLDSTVFEFGFNKPSAVIQFTGSGLYKIGVSLLITCTSGTSNTFYLCLNDGSSVVNTGRVVNIQQQASPQLIYTEYYYRSNGTTNLAFVIGADTPHLSLNTIAGITLGSTVLPSNPAAIVTIQQIE